MKSKSMPRKNTHFPLMMFITSLLFVTSQFAFANEIKNGNGQALPDIRWQDAEGNSHHLKDSNGKPRLLHFWAAWCFPCRTELPEMLEWIEKNTDIEIIRLVLIMVMAIGHSVFQRACYICSLRSSKQSHRCR
ncbi:TlpA family protein disulfide reductase [Pseudomonadota bacterium]